MKKKLPIGVENYIDVYKECYYVDKTLLIKEVLNLPSTSVILFTRPRRFGKSLSLSMLRTFFDKTIENSYKYFKSTNIEKEEDLCRNNLGKYDVIYLNFKDLNANNSKELIEKTKNLVLDEIKRFRYLYNDMSDINKSEFDNLIESSYDDAKFSSIIRKLCKIIDETTNNRPIILIDEYDSPLQSAFENGFYNDVIVFFKNFLSESLKGNNNQLLSILTGVSRTGKISLFSGLNNLIDDNVLTYKNSKYFGFTEEETKDILNYYNCDINIDEIKSWYGNYNFGGTCIFNPWSILNFINEGFTFKNYWSKTTSSSILSTIITDDITDLINGLNKLINDNVVLSNISASINYDDINYSLDMIYSLLLSMGYLTIDNNYDDTIYTLRNVNKETKNIFITEIRNKFLNNKSLEIGLNIKKALLSFDSELLSKSLEEYLLSSLSYYDFSDEKNYQIMILTLLSLIFDECIVQSEVISGTGRCDIILIPKNKNGFGAIIELKSLKSRTTELRLKNSAQTALKQIMMHKYYDTLIKTDAKKIYAYGLSFYKKSVEIAGKKIR